MRFADLAHLHSAPITPNKAFYARCAVEIGEGAVAGDAGIRARVIEYECLAKWFE